MAKDTTNQGFGKRRDGTPTSELSFRIDFCVGSRESKKQILSDVSGRVQGGDAVAILGPSGAG